MERKTNRGFVVLLFLVLSINCSRASATTPSSTRRQILGIRYWTAPDHTRVVLDMSSESKYSVRVFDNPPRLAINIYGGKLGRGVKPFEVKDGVIERIRINKLRSFVQVVLDLSSKSPFKHFALKPFRNRPHRIVVDVQRVLTTEQIAKIESEARAVATSGDYVVIIDPGHGGSQPGAVSKRGVREKDIVLKLAKYVANEINKEKGFRAILTRSGDYNVSLQRRIDIARKNGGDCFISLHLNSHYNNRARGSEVYFLSITGATDENAQAVAERENLFLEIEGRSVEYNDDLKEILFDLNRSNTMYESSILASEIASALKRVGVVPFRGVKQANFVVLRSIAMPSVLVEAAFLSNRKDVSILRKEQSLRRLAKAIASGAISYLKKNPPEREEVVRTLSTVHVVRSGDTLWGIARKYGMNLKELLSLNGLRRNSKIRPGQKLRVIVRR